jgi:hypothetical protein
MREARRGGVEQVGDDFFAGAVLAGNEHVGVGGADLRDEFEHRLHGGRAERSLRHAFGAEQAILEFELAIARRTA